MLLQRRPHPTIAWAAALALLVALLAPALVQTLAAVAGTAAARPGWVQVCTARGAVWVAGKPGPAHSPAQHPSPASAGLFEHCPFCHLPGQALALPPAHGPAWQPVLLAHARPLAAGSGPDTRQLWHDSQARAPPAGG